jgi:hypothetical protein
VWVTGHTGLRLECPPEPIDDFTADRSFRRLSGLLNLATKRCIKSDRRRDGGVIWGFLHDAEDRLGGSALCDGLHCICESRLISKP